MNNTVVAVESDIKKLRLEKGIVYLEDFGKGSGKIIVQAFDRTYSHYWSHMGEQNTLADFVSGLEPSYFVGKLLGARSEHEFCNKKTFASVRQEIRDRIPWYRNTEFQKEMRIDIRRFQGECHDSRYFVEKFNEVFSGFDYYMIDDKYERAYMIEELAFDEPWYFIGEKPTREYKYLCSLHDELSTYLKKNL